MKKLLFLLILVVFAFFYSFGDSLFSKKQSMSAGDAKAKIELMRVALVADSENENDLLEKALKQAQGMGVNFVIGLGDYSQVGTEKELSDAKAVFERIKIPYYLTAGDHDLWDSRNRGEEALSNFIKVFGQPSRVFEKNDVQFVILDNSDIYSGIKPEDWKMLNDVLAKGDRGPVTGFPPASARLDSDSESRDSLRAVGNPSSAATPRLTFVFAHKTPFHPQSAHVMGEGSEEVSRQARNLINILETNKVSGFFSGDLHFFATFNSPSGSVKMTTVGAASAERNFQGPRFAVLTIYNDYSWSVEDVEIR